MRRQKLTKLKSAGGTILDHQRLVALINSLPDGVLAVDQQGIVVLSNGGAMSVLDSNKLEGKLLSDVLQVSDKGSRPVDVGELLKNGTAFSSSDWRLRYKDGSFINLYISVSPVLSGYGSEAAGGYVIFLRDITKEKSLEEEREEFISVASHELRTPIAIAEGNISNAQLLAERSDLDDSIKQSLSEAHLQVVFLSNLINDLSMLSRAERGKLALTAESIDVKALVQELVHEHEPTAAQKGLKIETRVDESIGMISTSELYLKEILQNFITNAIKYTEKGHISVQVNSNREAIRFSVADSGIGIAQSEQSKLFSKFFRSADYRVQKNNGTGLGLYVCAKLALLLKGRIDVTTNLDHGSTFILSIPATTT